MSRVDQTLKFTMPASLTALSLQSYEFVTIEEPFYTMSYIYDVTFRLIIQYLYIPGFQHSIQNIPLFLHLNDPSNI